MGGCIAGGWNYLHINAEGDVEPRVFIHYSNCNIHDTSLIDALRSVVKTTGAGNTDYQSPESVDHLCDKTTPYAENRKGTADKHWSETCAKCGKCK